LSKAAIAWINYPHNPSGVSCTLDYLERQVRTAQKFGILLCADECYADIYFGEERPRSVLEVTTRGVLAFHSCSKRSGMTGYRSGFIAGDSTALELYRGFRDSLGTTSPDFIQAAAAAAWNDDLHAAKRCQVFAAKRQVFLNLFSELGLDVTNSSATLYLWVQAPAQLSSTEYAEILLSRGIVVTPGHYFAKSASKFFRLALVPSLEECQKAANAWRELHLGGI
ncbi:MAG: aminotransferase class I/II-fold pyridoxal phosphate-dependent enzyme, partial [Bdellovibrionales bacterium]|nr:aminotransferase class I/II-fold pyridoxal phosphate-dependent enzyme [Bdellovibrionales bacterium]